MRMANGWNTKKKIMNNEINIFSDVDFASKLAEDIGQHLVSSKVRKWAKGKAWDMFAGLVATQIIVIFNKQLKENGYELRKIEKHD